MLVAWVVCPGLAFLQMYEKKMKTPIEAVIANSKRPENRFKGNVSKEFGLMPKVPTALRLPLELRYVDTLVEDLPRLYRRGLVCRAILDLPRVSESAISRLNDEERIRLSMCFGLLAYSFRYAWEDAGEGAKLSCLPKVDLANTPVDQRDFHSFDIGNTCIRFIAGNLIGPWQQLWTSMGLQRPYFESALFTQNFKITANEYEAPERASQDRCELLLPFFATETERFFFLGVQEVTGKFNCIPALVAMQRAMQIQNHEEVIACCDELVGLWRGITEDVFMRFDTRIDPIEWGSSVGKWTASPFYKQEGFSGMFFPAFHILDLLLGRVKYESFLGDLIVKTREILPPNWQSLFEAIAEMNLKDYVERFATDHADLASSLVRLQDVYQLFFLVHRRKIFSFEYQAILTGRNSTNAGISSEVKLNQEDSVYDLATWNRIDDILIESGTERPLESLDNGSKCPFSGGKLADKAPISYPPTVASKCPFSGTSVERSIPLEDKTVPLIDTHWQRLGGTWCGFHGIRGTGFPLEVTPGDRCLVICRNETRVEGEFVGAVDRVELTIRLPEPVEDMVGIKLLPGTFARVSGAGPNAEQTQGWPVLVICSGDRSMLASTLCQHNETNVEILLVGTELDRDRLVELGCHSSKVFLTPSLEELDVATLPECYWEDKLVYSISGDSDFAGKALHWMGENLCPVEMKPAEWLGELRVRKTLRLSVFRSAKSRQLPDYYPWDVIPARKSRRLVVLNGRVLDITTFQHIHLGGDNILKLLSGVDISAEFARAHPGHQVNLPETLAVGDYVLPTELEPLVQYVYKLARAANVISVQIEKLAQYENAPSVYRQRAVAMISAIDLCLLWNPTGLGRQLTPQKQAQFSNAFRRLLTDVLSDDEQKSTRPAKQFLKSLMDCMDRSIENFVQWMKDSKDSPSSTLADRCFERHVEILGAFCLRDRSDSAHPIRNAPMATR